MTDKRKTQYPNQYFVNYRVVGSRCFGEFIVRANNPQEAKEFIEALDEDYKVAKSRITTVEKGAEEYSQDLEDFVENTIEPKGGLPKNNGQWLFLNSGT